MQLLEREPPEEDEALAWRNRLALGLLRAFFVVFLLSGVIVAIAVHGAPERAEMVVMTLVAASVVGYPALSGRPSGRARAWLVIVPATLASIAGYASVGFLSGPGAALTITLMLSGLLLGRRAMIALGIFCAASLSAIAWAMVNGVLPAPHPTDISMTAGLSWARSLGTTFLAIGLFGSLMVALVTRMERALRLARSETLRREQAERARAEAELIALEGKQLETVGRLAAGIAHDFNNNLTAIIGCAELLKLDLAGSSSSQELADDILQASQRASELTRQLLAYSRKAQMLQIPLDLHAVIEEAVSLARRSIGPEIEITTRLAARDSSVNGDQALLQSAVLNLLVNARDAMPSGGRLEISTRSLKTALGGSGASPVACVRLEVRDTGLGISKDLLPQIFDPFFTTKPLGKGTGLGLAAVAGTIKGHGGMIEVDSELGAGTTFRVTLPTLAGSSQTNDAFRGDIIRGEGEILLVEDDAMVSTTAIATLRSLGYEVTHVSDGQSAIDAVQATPDRFRLVLLDLRTPGLSGEATFAALHSRVPELPILIWSGYAAEQDVSSMLRRGAAGFVQKPYTVAELGRTIAQALGRKG